MGYAFKIAYPRLNETAKKFAQNEIVNVKIEVDEEGRVADAKSDSKIPILNNPFVLAAKQTRFSPSMVDGQAVKVKGQIIYKYYQGKAAFSYSFEPIEYRWTREDFELMQMIDSEIVGVIADQRVGKSLNSYAFISNGQANIQICMDKKKPEIVEKIKRTGFELSEETESNGLVGKIAVKNLKKLVDIEEIRFIVPEMPRQ